METLNLQPSDIKGNGASWLRQPVKVESRLNLKYVYWERFWNIPFFTLFQEKSHMFHARCFDFFCCYIIGQSLTPTDLEEWLTPRMREEIQEMIQIGEAFLPQQKSLPSYLSLRLKWMATLTCAQLGGFSGRCFQSQLGTKGGEMDGVTKNCSIIDAKDHPANKKK